MGAISNTANLFDSVDLKKGQKFTFTTQAKDAMLFQYAPKSRAAAKNWLDDESYDDLYGRHKMDQDVPLGAWSDRSYELHYLKLARKWQSKKSSNQLKMTKDDELLRSSSAETNEQKPYQALPQDIIHSQSKPSQIEDTHLNSINLTEQFVNRFNNNQSHNDSKVIIFQKKNTILNKMEAAPAEGPLTGGIVGFKEEWTPLTKFERHFKMGTITKVEDVYIHSIPIKEHLIVGNEKTILFDEIMCILSVQEVKYSKNGSENNEKKNERDIAEQNQKFLKNSEWNTG